MKEITFKCRLLSDVIISQKSATTGSHTTLDFIPGGNFYGIVANKFYSALNDALDDKAKADVFTVCHSGAVKFGDAHPAVAGKRSLRVPAAMFYPKLKGMSEIYLHGQVVELTRTAPTLFADKQLKQCRQGFYVFQDRQGIPAQVDKTFALKSAYDREQRRAKDAQMYGYESLNKGAEFIFSIAYDEAKVTVALIRLVQESLVGVQRIGRSRTAQYGLVEIEQVGQEQELKPTQVPANREMQVYADGRLIFLDAYGQPTCRPSAADFGVPQGEIVWEKSQVRTFQYAPWNYKRQAYDADRYGLEKGSVLVIRSQAATEIPPVVGAYQLEGFGRILVNPEFLQSNAADAKALFQLQALTGESLISEVEQVLPIRAGDSPLMRYVVSEHNRAYYSQTIYQKVDAFVANNKKNFRSRSFASQWGTIRRIAGLCASTRELRQKLYDGENREAYLTHGVAKEKWTEYNRLELLKAFVAEVQDAIPDAYVPLAVVNLAAEMGKKCSTLTD
jgi:hypothetical protein